MLDFTSLEDVPIWLNFSNIIKYKLSAKTPVAISGNQNDFWSALQDYPPDMQALATELVLEQAKLHTESVVS